MTSLIPAPQTFVSDFNMTSAWIPTTADDPSAMLSPEHNLWVAFIQQKIGDATSHEAFLGSSCVECHMDDFDCGCRTYLIPNINAVRAIEPNEHDQVQLTLNGRRMWVALNRVVQRDGRWYFRSLQHICKKAHTLRACAQAWLRSDDCDALCGELGLEASYLRKLANITR